jgi:hypothetical protein
VFDVRFVEHDAAVLFYRVMRSAKPWFELGAEGPSNSSARTRTAKAGIFDDPRTRVEVSKGRDISQRRSLSIYLL